MGVRVRADTDIGRGCNNLSTPRHTCSPLSSCSYRCHSELDSESSQTIINHIKDCFVYILASSQNGTLYSGVTNNLERRIYEHKQHLNKGFTGKYDVTKLVHFEQTNSIDSAIAREKQLKQWRRGWKLDLIEAHNPRWRDLADDFSLDPESSSG